MTYYRHPDGPLNYIEAGAGAPEIDWNDTPAPGAIRAWCEAGEGHPCPVCHAPKPEHEIGCWNAPEPDPSYRFYPDPVNGEMQ